jgi:hypothetical protein
MDKRVLTMHFTNKKHPDLPGSFSLSVKKDQSHALYKRQRKRATRIELAFRSRRFADSLGRLKTDGDKPAWTSLNVMTEFMTKEAMASIHKDPRGKSPF